MEYNASYLDTYKKYIGKGWYDNTLSSSTLESWLENFIKSSPETFDSRICAHFLLASLVFYQDKQLEAIIQSIEGKLKGQLNQSMEQLQGRRLSEEELKTAWEKYKQESYVLPAAAPDTTADSAHAVSRLWRNINHIELGTLPQLVRAIEQEGKKHIIFVDDFIGTGTKMSTFLSKNMEIYGFQNLLEIIKKNEIYVDFNVAVFAVHAKGLERLSKLPCVLNFYYGDFYDEEYDLLSEQCVLYYDIFAKNRSNIISYLAQKQQELDSTNLYALNLPISFRHGCPNNSLALYYKSTPFWVRLLPESHPPKSKKKEI